MIEEKVLLVHTKKYQVSGTFYRFNIICGGTLFSEIIPSIVVLFIKAIPAMLKPFMI